MTAISYAAALRTNRRKRTDVGRYGACRIGLEQNVAKLEFLFYLLVCFIENLTRRFAGIGNERAPLHS